MTPTNEDRSEWAEAALYAFEVETGMQGEEKQTVLTDLLTDLLHWAKRHNVSFERTLADAREHFAYECENPDE